MNIVPDLSPITSKDAGRENLSYVKVSKKETIACDAVIAVVFPTSDIFDADFIEGLPEDSVYIHREDWKMFLKSESIVWESKDLIKIKYKGKRAKYLKTESPTYRYPDVLGIIPSENGKATESKETIQIDAELLARLQKAMLCDSVKLSFYEKNSSIVVHGFKYNPVAQTHISPNGAYAVIMPVLQNR